jgi:hypothetical protein
MHDNALRPPSAGRGHMDLVTPVLKDPPQNCSTEVAERRAVTASKHRGHEPTVTRERQMSNGVDPLMHTMEAPPPHPPIDLGRAQAKRDELSSLHYAMLPPGQLGHRLIRMDLGRFFVHTTNK